MAVTWILGVLEYNCKRVTNYDKNFTSWQLF